uniref:Uncharacterized protein n=1 Tax=Strigamia maritima TaxID=126957 RepID=T1INH4_STRMM
MRCEAGLVGRSATSWLVTFVWGAVSVAVAGASLISFVQPAWFVRQEKRLDKDVDVFMFGAFSFCYRIEDDYKCHVYGGLMDSRRSPSGVWQVCGFLYGGGCILLCCCALAALLVSALPSPELRRQAVIGVAITQTVAVVLLLVGLVLFPVGLGSLFVRRHCGEDSSPYHSGSCQMGWSYTMAIVASILAVYCPLLAFLTTYKKYESTCYYWIKQYSIL